MNSTQHDPDPIAGQSDRLPETSECRAIDFARSFCYYVPRSTPIWVRMGIECRCEVFDRTAGTSDEYLLTVRTQTGLRAMQPTGELDPGYDFWMIFSRREIFVKRVHASAYDNSPSRAPLEEFVTSDWRLRRAPATPLRSGAAIRAALRDWKPVVARSEFVSADGERGYAIEYPVKWADGNDDDTFRVETGPVLLLDPDQVQVGRSPEFDAFQWAYLDYHSFDTVRCFLERPASLLHGTTGDGPMPRFRRNPPLTVADVAAIENRLYTGWEPPIPVPALKTLFQTNHYAAVTHLPVTTTVFALDGS